MSSRQPRFELCHGDDGWWARFRAANGRVVWVTETYTRKASARMAIDSIARVFSPLSQCWVDEGVLTPDSKATVRIGIHPGSGFGGAHPVPIRTVDERTDR